MQEAIRSKILGEGFWETETHKLRDMRREAGGRDIKSELLTIATTIHETKSRLRGGAKTKKPSFGRQHKKKHPGKGPTSRVHPGSSSKGKSNNPGTSLIGSKLAKRGDSAKLEGDAFHGTKWK